MAAISPSVKLIINLSKINAVMSRRFDNGLGGLGFNEFIVLFHLSQADSERMRRIDLAEKLGLTASGITRILLPMEKIGLIKKEAHERDARVSWVLLASGGKRRLAEALERAEYLADELIPADQSKKVKDWANIFEALGQALR
jgi:DNA-binding MarR family transcriptional regulator